MKYILKRVEADILWKLIENIKSMHILAKLQATYMVFLPMELVIATYEAIT